MRKEKRRRLEARGWKIGTVREFLHLSAEEAAYIDLKVRLATDLRERRRRRSLTQADLAKRLQSSQSRVAKMEAGDPSVSFGPPHQIAADPWRLASGAIADHFYSLARPSRITLAVSSGERMRASRPLQCLVSRSQIGPIVGSLP